jgi:hypothetical protein
MQKSCAKNKTEKLSLVVHLVQYVKPFPELYLENQTGTRLACAAALRMRPLRARGHCGLMALGPIALRPRRHSMEGRLEQSHLTRTGPSLNLGLFKYNTHCSGETQESPSFQ